MLRPAADSPRGPVGLCSSAGSHNWCAASSARSRCPTNLPVSSAPELSAVVVPWPTAGASRSGSVVQSHSPPSLASVHGSQNDGNKVGRDLRTPLLDVAVCNAPSFRFQPTGAPRNAIAQPRDRHLQQETREALRPRAPAGGSTQRSLPRLSISAGQRHSHFQCPKIALVRCSSN